MTFQIHAEYEHLKKKCSQSSSADWHRTGICMPLLCNSLWGGSFPRIASPAQKEWHSSPRRLWPSSPFRFHAPKNALKVSTLPNRYYWPESPFDWWGAIGPSCLLKLEGGSCHFPLWISWLTLVSLDPGRTLFYLSYQIKDAALFKPRVRPQICCKRISTLRFSGYGAKPKKHEQKFSHPSFFKIWSPKIILTTSYFPE